MPKPSSKLILAGTLLCLGLTACTDSSITAVKGSSFPQSDFTFGEALDDAKGCKSTAWSHRDDSNGRPVVEYTCTVEISSAQVDQAKKENADRIKAMSKMFETVWTDSLASIAQHKQIVEQSALRDRAEAEARLEEARARRQYLQQMMDVLAANQAKATAGQAEGKRTNPYANLRIEGEIKSTKSAIALADAQIARAENARDNPVAASSSEGNPEKSVADYDNMTQGMLAWKERYFAAVAVKDAAETRRANELIASAKDRKLQMKMTFQVNKKSPVQLRSATWVSDDQVEATINPALVAVVLLDPKRMQQVVDEAVQSRLKLPMSNSDALVSFPIVCGYEVPEGCALRKSAS